MKELRRTRWFPKILVVVLVAIAFTAGNLSASMQQTHMEEALAALNSAKMHLGLASADKGGHRAKAIKAVNEAILHVNEGIAYAKRH